jgi:putative hydrolase of the HAD superfamily
MIILFDLDDTLVNQKDAAVKASTLFLNEFKDQLSYDENAFPKIWWAVMQKYSNLFIEGKLSFQEQRRYRIREIFNQKELGDEKADRIFAVYLQHLEENWKLFNDVIPCLDSLSHYPKGLVTNGNGIQQRKKLEKLDLLKYFNKIIISEELGFSKPQREIFLAASNQFGCNPSECFFIGDNLEVDVIGSNEVGMNGIWLNRENIGILDDNIIVIQNLVELKSKIEIQ